MIIFQDVSEFPESQWEKEYHKEESNMPGGRRLGAASSEVLRQIDGAAIAEGGVVIGDAWFGSVTVAVEAKLRKGVNSMWIIKNNTAFFPTRQLDALLKARGDGTKWVIGDHVVATAVCEGVKYACVAYAWSRKGCSYFVTTVGDTDMHPDMYCSEWKDENEKTHTKMIPRPNFIYHAYKYLPNIDEHNAKWQYHLGMERKFPTKDPFFKLMLTLTAMSIVDCKQAFEAHFGSSYGEDMTTEDFADQISASLNLKPSTAGQQGANFVAKEGLKRLRDVVESPSKATKTQKADSPRARSGRGPALKQQTCWNCRRYSSTKVMTTTVCGDCKTPICNRPIAKLQFRNQTCIHEHVESSNPLIRCNGTRKPKFFPKEAKYNSVIIPGPPTINS